MADRYELAGKKFGKWLVGQRVDTPPSIKSRFNVTCECGTVSVVLAFTLVNGASTQCQNCKYKQMSEVAQKTVGSLTGQVIRNWTIGNYQTGTNEAKACYHCTCKCGNTRLVTVDFLLRSDSTACRRCPKRKKRAPLDIERGRKCGESFPRTKEFWKRSTGKSFDGFMRQCRKCCNLWNIGWEKKNNPIRKSNYVHTMFRNAKNHHKPRGLEFDLTEEWIAEQYARQNGRCYYTGRRFEINAARRHPLYPTLDRVDSSRGYTADNVVIAALWVNGAKTNMPVELFLELLSDIKLPATRLQVAV